MVRRVTEEECQSGILAGCLPDVPESYGPEYFEGAAHNVSISAYASYAQASGIVSELVLYCRSVVPALFEGTVVDAGCAYGHSVRSLAAQGVDAYGFDFSPYAIETGKKMYSQIADRLDVRSLQDRTPLKIGEKVFKVGNSSRPVGTFLCFEVLEHLPQKDVDGVLKFMARHADWGIFTVECRTAVEAKAHDQDETHQTHLPKTWWVDKFSEHGILDWDSMYDFGVRVAKKEPDITWGRRFFVVKFSK